jgi:hypothetical protein
MLQFLNGINLRPIPWSALPHVPVPIRKESKSNKYELIVDKLSVLQAD